ncbi:MAG TPA: MFS transporter [Mycobacteriales bacterium]|nr:MFS transporter [Mycobacteriales bacterium]
MTAPTASRRTLEPQPGFTRSTTVPTPTSSPALSTAGLITILVGVLLPLIDFFIVNVALPTMQHDLHATTALLELVVSGYATAYAVLLVLGGRLGDAHGRRRLFLVGIASFTLTSLLCGIAPSATTLVIARVLQGASAALMVPQTLSTIQATGTPASRSKALGWLGATGGLAAVTGQLLGGVLVSANIGGSGWRAIFFVNIPVGVIGLILAARYVPETHAVRRTQIDVLGTLLLAVTLVAVLIPLTEGRALGWPVWSWVLLALAPVSAIGFGYVERSLERTGGAPLVPPSVLEHNSMRRGLILAVPFFATFGAFMFVYALVTQGYLGFGPLRAGLAMGPMAVLFLLASLATTRLVAEYGRKVIAAGALIQLVGLLILIATFLAWWPHISVYDLMPGLAVMGMGQGLILSPLYRVVLSDVPQEVAGAGSGVLTTTQQTSLALGVALIGSLFVSLATASRLGPLHAAVTILAIQAVVAAGLAAGSRLLPRGGRAASPTFAQRESVVLDPAV